MADFSPTEHHVGYPGVVHGGIIYSALDDSMANWLYLRGARAYTARSSVRYRATVAPGEALRLEGRAVSRRGRVVEMAGVASRASDGELMAEATATFVVVEGRDRIREV
ncbi:MAG: PaaI family thioesterase [Gemmatimonadetes bacterium]|nr:PaaI family thioesterase [Gemmatimonadota bacterium]MCY3942966.1 PaaI family thioesterase [Gemmatimonadota bacterium]